MASVVTIGFDINRQISLQESGPILCNQEHIRRKSSIPFTSKYGQRHFKGFDIPNECFELLTKEPERIDKKGDRELQKEDIYEHVCEGVGLLKNTKPSSPTWNPEHSFGSLSRGAKIEKCFETAVDIEKQDGYIKNVNCLETSRRNSLKDSEQSKSDKKTIQQTKNLHDAKIQSKDTSQDDYNQSNQLPDIFLRNKNYRIKRSSANEESLVFFDENMSRTHTHTSQTQGQAAQTVAHTAHTRAHSLDYTRTNSVDRVKEYLPTTSISVLGFQSVMNNSDVKTKWPGSYDVRYKYAMNIEKNWYEKFQREVKLKADHNSEQEVESFGYCSDEIHKKSLFNHLRDEYETSLSNRNCKTFNYDTNVGRTACEISDQAGDISCLETTPRVNFNPKDPSLKIVSTDVLDGDFGKIKSRDVTKSMDKHIQAPCHDQPPSDEDKGHNTAIRLQRLSITEIRALRLKLKNCSQFQRNKSTLKGIRRFRQIAFVVMFTLHFRSILLKLRGRKQKQRTKTIKQQRLAKEKNTIYSPFERSWRPTRVSVPKKVAETQLEKSISRYEFELNRIMQDCDQFASLSESVSPGQLRRRHFSDLGPPRSTDFCIMLSTPSKRNTNRRKQICRSAHQKRDVEQGRFEGRMLQRKFKNARSKTDKEKVGETGLIAQIKLQLNIKNIPKTNQTKQKSQEIVIVKDLSRRRTLDDISLSKQSAVDLRSLLKDVDMPAKEIKIQIAERKMKRRHTRHLLLMEECKEITEKLKITHERVPVRRDILKRRKWSYSLCRDVMSGVRWQGQQKGVKPEEKLNYDEEIANLSSLVLQMRSCRYIRWTKRYQNILTRLEELECAAI